MKNENYDDLMKKAIGIACTMDAGFGQIEFLCSTLLDKPVDMGDALIWINENKNSMRMEYVFGYDESWFDLWWDNIGFDNIAWDDELGIISK